MPAPSEEGKDTRYDGGGQNDPPELATRTAALQALSTAKTAEAEELSKKVEEARAAFKQQQRESARAAKALKSAERASKKAVDWLADAEKALARAKNEKATKRAEAQKAKATAKVAETKAKLEAVTAENKPALEELARAEEAFKAIDAEQKAVAAEARAAIRKLSPVSVFVSLKANKLYIRQDMEQIYEGDVTIRDPDKPIGTHVFTAMARSDTGKDAGLRWTAVTIDGGDDAKNALDRITIPQDVLDRIAPTALPRSSIIVSDEPLSAETNYRTEFVAVLSNQPQGGFITRQPTNDGYFASNDGYFFSRGNWDNAPRRGDYQRDYYNRRAFPFFIFGR